MERTIARSLSLTSLAWLIITVSSAASTGAADAQYTQNNVARDSQEMSFSLTRLPENPKQYSLVLSDNDEHTISGTFSVDQLQILRAIMTEAEKFALSEEAAGIKEPITTRFMDRRESAFEIDVQKVGNQSRLFLTLKTELGHMTTNAGKIARAQRREEGFFFDLLSQLESVLPKLPSKPSN